MVLAENYTEMTGVVSRSSMSCSLEFGVEFYDSGAVFADARLEHI